MVVLGDFGLVIFVSGVYLHRQGQGHALGNVAQHRVLRLVFVAQFVSSKPHPQLPPSSQGLGLGEHMIMNV